jgi:YfiH family protein
METIGHPSWSVERIGCDHALVRRVGNVFMAFGLGPARGAAKEPSRLESIIDDRVAALRFCQQVHGRRLHRIETVAEPVVEVGPGDGLVTTAPGVGLLVWTADCVPVLLAAGGAVAAIHSGWRGCAADVVGAALEQLEMRHHAQPDRVRAALGPSVCGSCYEVGSEVPEALQRFNLDDARWLAGNRVDLRGFLTARLEALGVPAENIESVGPCTAESPELASYRRDRAAAGRQWSMVYLHHRKAKSP